MEASARARGDFSERLDGARTGVLIQHAGSDASYIARCRFIPCVGIFFTARAVLPRFARALAKSAVFSARDIFITHVGDARKSAAGRWVVSSTREGGGVSSHVVRSVNQVGKRPFY